MLFVSADVASLKSWQQSEVSSVNLNERLAAEGIPFCVLLCFFPVPVVAVSAVGMRLSLNFAAYFHSRPLSGNSLLGGRRVSSNSFASRRLQKFSSGGSGRVFTATRFHLFRRQHTTKKSLTNHMQARECIGCVGQWVDTCTQLTHRGAAPGRAGSKPADDDRV